MRTKTSLQESLDKSSLSRDLSTISARFGMQGVNLQSELFQRLMAVEKGGNFTVLDVGCGEGVAIEQTANMVKDWAGPMKREVEAIGVDVNPLNDKDSASAKFMEGSASALPLPDNSVDFGYSSQTFCYVDDPLKALAECHRVLKPGGMMVVDVRENDISGDTKFVDILKKTPGAEKVFIYSEITKGKFTFGCVTVRKGFDDEFKGFQPEKSSTIGVDFVRADVKREVWSAAQQW